VTAVRRTILPDPPARRTEQRQVGGAVASILDICRWLADSGLATRLRESDNLFSALEAAHVIGIVGVAGTIAIADLRVLGLLLKTVPVAEVLTPLAKVAWGGFALMAATGVPLFCAEAAALYANGAFWAKLALIAAAGLNQWLFHHHLAREMARPPGSLSVAAPARWSAAASLTLWMAIIISGRAIAYV